MKMKTVVLSMVLALSAAMMTSSAQAKGINLKKEIKKMCDQLGGEFWEDGDEYGCMLEDDKDEIFCFESINECDLYVDGEVYNPNPLKRRKIRKLKQQFGITHVGTKSELYAAYPEHKNRKKKVFKKLKLKWVVSPGIIAPNN